MFMEKCVIYCAILWPWHPTYLRIGAHTFIHNLTEYNPVNLTWIIIVDSVEIISLTVDIIQARFLTFLTRIQWTICSPGLLASSTFSNESVHNAVSGTNYSFPNHPATHVGEYSKPTRFSTFTCSNLIITDA